MRYLGVYIRIKQEIIERNIYTMSRSSLVIPIFIESFPLHKKTESNSAVVQLEKYHFNVV